MAASPPPAPQRKSNVLWWILGVLVAAVVLFGLGAFLAVTYVARSVKVEQSGDRVEISTPVGSLRASKDKTADPGLPVFPGATVSDTGGSVELAGPDNESVAIVASKYNTTDNIEKVDAWYAEKLGSDFKREGPGITTRKKEIVGIHVESGDIAFISEKEGLVRIVALKKRFNGVEIGLVRIGKNEAQ